MVSEMCGGHRQDDLIYIKNFVLDFSGQNTPPNCDCPMRLRLAFFLALMLSAWSFTQCAGDADDTARDALILLYAQKSQASTSCVYYTTTGTSSCIDNVDPAASFGSMCNFIPLLNGAKSTIYSSSSCADQGYTTCSTLTQSGTSYNLCTQ